MVLDNLAGAVFIAVAAVCPIQGVAIGDAADKSTWRIDFDPSATVAQKSAAKAALAVFDPMLAAQAGQLPHILGSGLTITSAGTPSLNGTYAVDDQSRSDLQGILLDALGLGTFPGGGATFPYPDMSGTPHIVTVGQLKAIGSAITGYAVAVKRAAAILLAGASATYPPRTVQIA